MKVEVYKNLHKNCWSVRDSKTGKVIDHVNYIHLDDATFVVRPAGRAKVLQEKRKNVHAFIKGTASFLSEHINKVPYATQIYYDPYKYESFVYADSEEPIFKSNAVYLNNKGEVYVY